MSFGTSIVLTTQQIYGISGEGGGQRDPLMYAADYRPSIPHQLAQTPSIMTPCQAVAEDLRAGPSPIGHDIVVNPTPIQMCAPRQLRYDNKSDSTTSTSTTQSSSCQHQDDVDDDETYGDDSDGDDDYPSSDSWVPTPQPQRRPMGPVEALPTPKKVSANAILQHENKKRS